MNDFKWKSISLLSENDINQNRFFKAKNGKIWFAYYDGNYVIINHTEYNLCQFESFAK